MTLILDPERYEVALLEGVVRSLREDLEGTLSAVLRPRGPVRDPASLDTAAMLGWTTLAVLDGPAPTDRAEWARRANLAYATILALVDLVKSHTEVPKVPRPRSPTPEEGPPPGPPAGAGP